MTDETTASSLTCTDCGRAILPHDEERTWARCRFCGKAVCFHCIRYVPRRVKGPFMDYVEVMRACNECYPPRR